MRVGFEIHIAPQPNTNFRTIIASQYRAVLNKRYLYTQPCCGDSCARACYAAADHDQVKLAGIFRPLAQTECFSPKGRHLLALVRRGQIGIGREDNRIASALEAGQIVQGEGNLLLCNLDRSPVLPVPLGTLGTEDRLKQLIIYEHLELAWSARRLPRRRPVPRPHPHTVLSRLWELHRCRGVLDWFP